MRTSRACSSNRSGGHQASALLALTTMLFVLLAPLLGAHPAAGLVSEDDVQAPVKGKLAAGLPPSGLRARMNPFRLERQRDISTTRARLELSIPAAPLASEGDLLTFQPATIDGKAFIWSGASSPSVWSMRPGNVGPWRPHVTINKNSGRVTIIAPTILFNQSTGVRVPMILALNCTGGLGNLDCYSAASIFERAREAEKSVFDDSIESLGLGWEPSKSVADAENLLNNGCCWGYNPGGGSFRCKCTICWVQQGQPPGAPDQGCSEACPWCDWSSDACWTCVQYLQCGGGCAL